MKREQLISLLLFFSDSRFAAKGKKSREIYLEQFSTYTLEKMYRSKLRKLYKLMSFQKAK